MKSIPKHVQASFGIAPKTFGRVFLGHPLRKRIRCLRLLLRFPTSPLAFHGILNAMFRIPV